MSSSLDEHISLLSGIEFFTQFQSAEIKKLASMMEQVSYPENTAVVKEGEVVDNLFIIIEGFLEVTKQQSSRSIQLSSIQLKMLGPGDTIGLSASGFFSQTGLRTATVTTLSPVTVLSLKIQHFHEFLKNSSLKEAELFHTSELWLKMDLIKRATLFSSLSIDKIRKLSASVEQITVDQNTFIFRQNEIGDKCYLVLSGELVVMAEDERVLTTLKSPMIFGETSLLTDSPRNASVRTTTTCKLLVIHKQQLQEILQDNEAAQYASHLVITRSRPKHYAHVSVYHRETSDGEKIVILKNHEEGRYYRLSRMGWYIWQLLDGKHTLQEIADEMFKSFLLFSPEVIGELVSNLVAGGFVQIPTGSQQKYRQAEVKLPWWQGIFKYLAKVMEVQCSLKHTDQFVSKLYKKGGYLFFNVPAQLIFLCLLISGIILFGFLAQTALVSLKTVSFWLLLTYIPLTLLSIICHELAHALTTKAFGFEVLRFGFGWYWIGPIAFADTSDMWLGTRSQRIIVNAAGVYVDMVFAGAACIVAALCANHYPHVTAVLWLFALFNYISVFKNLDPTLMFDGYYILMDSLNKPNLRRDTVSFLAEKLPGTKYQWKKLKKYKKELIYILVCTVFLVISVCLVLWLQKSVVAAFLPHLIDHPSVYYQIFRWMLPVLVIFLSGMGIFAELREKQARAKVAKRG